MLDGFHWDENFWKVRNNEAGFLELRLEESSRSIETGCVVYFSSVNPKLTTESGYNPVTRSERFQIEGDGRAVVKL